MGNEEQKKNACNHCKEEIPEGKRECPKCQKRKSRNTIAALIIAIFTLTYAASQFEENTNQENQIEGEISNGGNSEELKELYSEEDVPFVDSSFLFENSEFYSESTIATMINVSGTGRKTIYTEEHVYCEFENSKDMNGIKEGNLICVAGTVKSGQKVGKVVELENCHILAAGDECDYFSKRIEEEKDGQSEYIANRKEGKAYEIIQMEDKYKLNFYHACESCGIDVFKVDEYAKLPNWDKGERYSFFYGGSAHNVYLLDDGTIESINFCQNTSIKLYENGYEPLNIEDFLIDVGTLSSLQVASEAIVKQSLNYPSSANFDWLTTGSYSRIYDYYVLTAEFSAKNAFGMKDRHRFRIDCTYSEENGSSLVYYELDGVAQSGSPSIPKIEKNLIKD